MCRCVGIECRGGSVAPQRGVQQRDLALCAVQLRADIGDILAEVTVTQTFRNAHSAALEVGRGVAVAVAVAVAVIATPSSGG